MKLLDIEQLNEDIGIIQLLHGRLGLDLSNSMAYHTGNFSYIEFLNTKNILIGNYLEILNMYEIIGDAAVTDLNNVLSIEEIENIIDDCYRNLEKYNIVADDYVATIPVPTPPIVVSQQYIVYANSLVLTPASTIYTDGTYEVRKRIDGNAYYIDVGLTPTGFDGVEDTDWTWVSKYNGQTAVFRSGVRDGDFVVDGTITGTGFAGSEDTDWENHTTAGGGGVLTTYRDGIRDQSYVIDKVLTATGFAGTEDVDWENIRTYKPV